MQAGPAQPSESEDLADRLGRLVSTVDDAGRAQMDRGQALVLALSDQLAAGQTETLYTLQTAASTVRDRATALTRLAEELPEEIGGRVATMVDELAQAATLQINHALDEASTRLGIALKSVQRELGLHQEAYLTALKKTADATATGLGQQQGAYLDTLRSSADEIGSRMGKQQEAYLTTLREAAEDASAQLKKQQAAYLSALRESAEATGVQLSNELEQAAKTIVDSAARAKASQTAVRAAAVAAVETLETAGHVTSERVVELQEQLMQFADQASEGMEQATTAFAEDAQAVTQGMSAVTESFIARLFEVLDSRDARDRKLEERLNARVDRLLARAGERLTEVAVHLEGQITRLEDRDLTERARTADELHGLVVRLLAEPRGKLRDLRSSAKQLVPQPAPRSTPTPPPAATQPPAGAGIAFVLEDPWAEDKVVPGTGRSSVLAPAKKPAPRKTVKAAKKAPAKAATKASPAPRKASQPTKKAPTRRPNKKEAT